MRKRLVITFILAFLLLAWFDFQVFAGSWPEFNCKWLPWCEFWDQAWDENVLIDFLSWTIKTFIQYIAIIAVISVMISWIMYLVSWWEEEKINRAKKWIIWSLVWVILSISAWWIINFINQLSINN